MKLKKIVSALIAFSMVSAMGIVNVSAAENYANPVIHVTSEVFADTAAANYKPVDGYTTYLVTYALEGVDYSDGETAAAAITVDYTVSGTAGVEYLAKSFTKSVKTGAANKKDLNGIYTETSGLQMISAKQIAFADAAGLWDFIDYETYENGSPANVVTKPFIQTLIYVKSDSSVTLTYNTALTGAQSSSMIELLDGTKWDDELVYNVNGKVGNTLTLGAAPVVPDPEPAKPVITGTTASTDVTVTDDNKGKVWNGIKIEDVANGENYKVKFSDGADNITFDLNLNNKQIEGDISFAVVLKTAKDLANITMEILYDLVDAQ